MAIIRIFLFLVTISTLIFSDNTMSIIAKFRPSSSEIKDGASVITKKITTTINADGTFNEKVYYLIAILNEKAANDYSTVTKKFKSHDTDVKLDFARSISKEGDVLEIAKDAIVIKGENNGYLDDTKHIVFAIPSVNTNSFIEYQLTYTNKKPLLPGNFMISGQFDSIQGDQEHIRFDSVRNSILEIHLPKNHSIYTNLQQKAKKNSNTMYDTYTWEMSNIDSLNFAISVGSEFAKKHLKYEYVISSFSDWKALSAYLNNAFDSAILNQQQAALLARKITQNAKTKRDKIEAIFSYFQKNIKYVYAHVGSNGYVPHNADQVLINHYGDCKDQSTLFASMLRSIGIEDASIALVSDNPNQQIDEQSIPSIDYFNHAIVYIPSEKMWVDTTVGKNGTFPGSNHLGSGLQALVLQKNNIEFLDIPKTSSSDNKIELHTKSQLLKTNQVKINTDIELYGIFDLVAKTANQSQEFKKEYLKYLEEIYVGSRVAINSFGVNQSKDKFNINYDVYIDNMDVAISSLNTKDNVVFFCANQMMGKTAFFTNILRLPKPSDNENGLTLGYPYEISENFECMVPDKAKTKSITIKEMPNLKSDDMEYISKRYENNNSTIMETKFKLKNYDITQAKYQNFYTNAQAIIYGNLWVEVYARDAFGDKIKKISSQKDVKSQKELIELYVDTADYEKAKLVLQDLLKKYPKDAELYYMLGIVYGYLGDDENSKKFIDKSNKLKI